MEKEIDEGLKKLGLPKEIEKTINDKILPRINKEHKDIFIQYHLLKTLKHKPNKETWNVIAQIVPQLRTNRVEELFEKGLPEILKHKPNKETWKAILEILPKINTNLDLPFFFEWNIPQILEQKPNKESWKAISTILLNIKKGDQHEFLTDALPKILQNKPNKQKWKTIENMVQKIHPDSRLALLYQISKTIQKPDFQKHIETSKKYLQPQPNRFYDKIVAENLSGLAPKNANINRLKFKKTHSELIPLGGKLHGIILRKINPESYQQWLKAYQDPELQPHVEPILYKKGTPRTIHGKNQVTVPTKYVGEIIYDFIQKHPELETEIRKQQQWIKQKLEEKGIEHGHAHDNNFTVELKNKKPHIYIIDFDTATSKQKTLQPKT